jgi:hypothetical protein
MHTQGRVPIIEQLESRCLLAGVGAQPQAVLVPNLRASTSKLYTSDIRGGASGLDQILVISNIGTGPLIISGLAYEGASRSSFVVNNALALPYTVAAGGLLRLRVAMKAPSSAVPGIYSAILNITSNDPDRPIGKVLVRGLASESSGGTGEPSLQRIMDLFQLGIDVGDTDPATSTLEPNVLDPGDELRVQRLYRAGPGPITIQTLAAYGTAANPAVSLGYYEPGTAGISTELLQIPGTNSQTVRPLANGSVSFDPGTAAFGLVGMFPFHNTSDGSARKVYSEDVLNQWETDPTRRRKVRFYRLPGPGGTFQADTFVFAFEEANYASSDNQDFVGVIRNVRSIPSGPELGVVSVDGGPYPDRLEFSRIRNLDPVIPNTFHRSATLRVLNTGNEPLIIDDIQVTGPWLLRTSFPGSFTIKPGGVKDLVVRFEAGGGDVSLGSMRLWTNDADEPIRVIELAGFWQIRSENQQEPSLVELGQVFGLTTVFAYDGQALNGGGRREAVGDEVLSRYFVRANSDEPVTVQQLAAFHTQGNAVPVSWYRKGTSTSRTTIFTHLGTDSQTVLPRKIDLSGPAVGRFEPTGAFGFVVHKAYSDNLLNPQEVADGNHGHAVRFFPVRDRVGAFVPNTYLMVMDYYGVNYDYNDNVYLVQNIRPEDLPATPVGLTAIATASGAQLDWGDSSGAGLLGYHVYRSTRPTTGFENITPTTLTVSQFVDTEVSAGTTMYYRVVALTSAGKLSMPASVVFA